MSKRSEFDRIDKDVYRTIDPRAVAALVPHLPDEFTFAEPCAGLGDLAQELHAQANCACASWGDIVPQPDISERDALSLTSADLGGVDLIITNPPWSRPLLHQMITHFASLKPTWLLFDADWAHTQQSVPYMALCTDIVSIGRLIWIPGTTMTGKDNCAWYRFASDKTEPTRFHGRFGKQAARAA